MAVVTQAIASFNDGQVHIELDYDDTTRRMVWASVINDSVYPVWLRIVKPSRNVDFSLTVAAGNTVSRHLSTRLVYEWLLDEGLDAEGDPLGYNLSLGDIVIQSRWPA